MARKVFISFLGGGTYKECVYYRNDFKSETVTFIQEATLKYLLKEEDWASGDAAYIMLTEGARKSNWVDNGINLFTKQTKQQVGLNSRLLQMKLPFKFYDVGVPNGNDESEVMDIFIKLFECVQEEDQLYLDITHGFRYLPMLMVVFGNYAKFLKNASVKSITYGNYEDLGVEKPIMDFLPLSVMQDWTYGVGQFLVSGDAKVLLGLAQNELRPILRESKGNNEEAKWLNIFLGKLNEVIEQRRYCRGVGITESRTFSEMKSAAEKLSTTIIAPLNPLFDKIKTQMEDFPENDVRNGYRAARWCFEHGLDQQAATILEEFVVSFFCEKYDIDLCYSVKNKKRELVNNAFTVVYNGIPEDGKDGWGKREVCSENRDLFLNLIEDPLLTDKSLSQAFYILSQTVRNDINHAGMRDCPLSPQKLHEKIKKCLSTIENVLSL